jgi:hypothetical protein
VAKYQGLQYIRVTGGDRWQGIAIERCVVALHREYTVILPSLHSVRMTGPLTFLAKYGMRLSCTLCVFQFVCTWSI